MVGGRRENGRLNESEEFRKLPQFTRVEKIPTTETATTQKFQADNEIKPA